MKTFKIITITVVSGLILGLSACKSANQRFFSDNTNYTNSQEQPPLKFPAGSLPVSNRYDIPVIPNDSGKVIEEITPPDY